MNVVAVRNGSRLVGLVSSACLSGAIRFPFDGIGCDCVNRVNVVALRLRHGIAVNQVNVVAVQLTLLFALNIISVTVYVEYRFSFRG